MKKKTPLIVYCASTHSKASDVNDDFETVIRRNIISNERFLIEPTCFVKQQRTKILQFQIPHRDFKIGSYKFPC